MKEEIAAMPTVSSVIDGLRFLH